MAWQEGNARHKPCVHKKKSTHQTKTKFIGHEIQTKLRKKKA